MCSDIATQLTLSIVNNRQHRQQDSVDRTVGPVSSVQQWSVANGLTTAVMDQYWHTKPVINLCLTLRYTGHRPHCLITRSLVHSLLIYPFRVMNVLIQRRAVR